MEEYNLNEPLISNKDIENNEAQIDLMIDLNIRKGFIVKVYTILIFQILFTSLFVFCAYYSQSFYNLLINSLLIFFFFSNSFNIITNYCSMQSRVFKKSTSKLYIFNCFYFCRKLFCCFNDMSI